MTQKELDRLCASVSQRVAMCQKEVLTLEEAALYIGISQSSLYKLTSARKIPFSKPNGKNCFFRRTELEEWLMGSPVAPKADVIDKAREHCARNPLSGGRPCRRK